MAFFHCLVEKLRSITRRAIRSIVSLFLFSASLRWQASELPTSVAKAPTIKVSIVMMASFDSSPKKEKNAGILSTAPSEKATKRHTPSRTKPRTIFKIELLTRDLRVLVTTFFSVTPFVRQVINIKEVIYGFATNILIENVSIARVIYVIDGHFMTSSKIYLTANIAYTSIYSCPKINCQRALGLMKYQTIGQVMWIIASHDRWLIDHWHGHRLNLNPVLPSASPRE